MSSGLEGEAVMAAKPVVEVRAPAPITLRLGGSAEARLTTAVAEGYHVQANPASDRFLIPLRLALKAKGGVRPGRPVYPLGQPYRLEGSSSDLMTYGGSFEIVVPLEATASARPGEHVLRGVLRYQACDTRTCLFPASLPVAIPVRVLAPKAGAP